MRHAVGYTTVLGTIENTTILIELGHIVRGQDAVLWHRLSHAARKQRRFFHLLRILAQNQGGAIPGKIRNSFIRWGLKLGLLETNYVPGRKLRLKTHWIVKDFLESRRTPSRRISIRKCAA